MDESICLGVMLYPRMRHHPYSPAKYPAHMSAIPSATMLFPVGCRGSGLNQENTIVGEEVADVRGGKVRVVRDAGLVEGECSAVCDGDDLRYSCRVEIGHSDGWDGVGHRDLVQ